MLLNSKSTAVLFITIGLTATLNLPKPQSGIHAVWVPQNLSSPELSFISTANNFTEPTQTAPLLNTTIPDLGHASNDLQVRCTFGHDLVYNDCIDALSTFGYIPDQALTINQRSSHTRFDLNLPVRWISGDSHGKLDEKTYRG